MNKVIWSADKDEWATSQDFYDGLNDKYSFTLDPCADSTNAKCSKFYTMNDDGLSKDWGGETVFCNPPYSKAKEWMQKAYEESKKPNTRIVMLIPARTDVRYFHDYCMDGSVCSEIILIKGRLKFGGSKNAAPFPSILVIFDGKGSGNKYPNFSAMNNK